MLKQIARGLRRRKPRAAHFDLVPEAWDRATRDARVKGWNVAAVVDAQLSRLAAWREALGGATPLGMRDASRLYTSAELATHNSALAFAYVAARAAAGRDALSMLDWGGGVGQYAFAAEAVLPGVRIDYACKELPVQCVQGQRLLPDATFYTDDAQFAERQFDLVFASGALHYDRDWRGVLDRLAAATGRYLFVTRLPTVSCTPSFVYLQRAYEHGYDTEYLGWCLNRDEFLTAAERTGLRFEREFLVAESGQVPGVAEHFQSRGFLFARHGG
jgi:putative methyltransferase (TIGR04325 family)